MPAIDRILYTGWAQIAAALGVSQRTAKRYHYECGLPVLRHPGDPRRPVTSAQIIHKWMLDNQAKLLNKKLWRGCLSRHVSRDNNLGVEY